MMDLEDYIVRMPEFYKSVLETVHVSEDHPMYHQYVNDSIWKFMHGDSIVNLLSMHVELRGLNVIDGGGGGGGISTAFAKSGANVVATDVDTGYQRLSLVGYKEWGVHAHSLLCDGQKLPFKDGSFDVICCFNIFEHVPNVDLLFHEMARVLNSDGIVIGRADYKYDRTNIRKDPHYGLPLIILLPRFLRKIAVINLSKRSTTLDDFTWAKNFGEIRKRFHETGLDVYQFDGDFIAIQQHLPDTPDSSKLFLPLQLTVFGSGWYPYESWGSRCARWSQEVAELNIKQNRGVSKISFDIFSVERKKVNFQIGNTLITREVSRDWQNVLIDVPSNRKSNIKLFTSISKVDGDLRNLGVAVSNIQFFDK